jgi:hypothetical protein
MDFVGLSLDGAFGDVRYEADLSEGAAVQCDLAGAFDPCTTLRISMPVGDAGHRLGCLTLAQRLEGSPPEYYVLRRMEQLRRTVSRALLRIQQERQAQAARTLLLTPRTHRPAERAGDRAAARADAGSRAVQAFAVGGAAKASRTQPPSRGPARAL